MLQGLDMRAGKPSSVPGTASELQRVTRARSKRDRAAAELERSILEAIGAGHSLRTVARAAGFTHARIGQIVAAARQSDDSSTRRRAGGGS